MEYIEMANQHKKDHKSKRSIAQRLHLFSNEILENQPKSGYLGA